MTGQCIVYEALSNMTFCLLMGLLLGTLGIIFFSKEENFSITTLILTLLIPITSVVLFIVSNIKIFEYASCGLSVEQGITIQQTIQNFSYNLLVLTPVFSLIYNSKNTKTKIIFNIFTILLLIINFILFTLMLKGV